MSTSHPNPLATSLEAPTPIKVPSAPPSHEAPTTLQSLEAPSTRQPPKAPTPTISNDE